MQLERMNPVGLPSSADLKQLADDLMSKMAEVNNDPLFQQDSKADTMAVGMSKGELIITGNLKERRPADSTEKAKYVKIRTPNDGNQNAKYVDYGISFALSEVILTDVRNSPVFTQSQLNVTVVEEKLNPKDITSLDTMLKKATAHAEKHAEMKTLAYCEQTGDTLRKIGVSKELCGKKEEHNGCYEEMRIDGVDMMPNTPGTKAVKNWRVVDKDEVKVISRIDKSPKLKQARTI